MTRSIGSIGSIVSIATVCVLTLGAAFPAFAAQTDTAPPKPTVHSSLAGIQAAGATEASKRVTALNSGITRVTATTTLTAADKTTILATLNGDLSGMKSLQAKIAANTEADSNAASADQAAAQNDNG